jgi:hypothetical protein
VPGPVARAPAPVSALSDGARCPLRELRVLGRRPPASVGHHNRLVERKVAELGGIKSLYSDSYYERDAFWRIYDETAYRALTRKYDPAGRFPDLYEKCVLRR